MTLMLMLACCVGGGEPLDSVEVQSLAERESAADPALAESRSGRESWPSFGELLGWSALMLLSLGAMIALPALLI